MSELGKMKEKMRQILRERAAFPLAHPIEETLDQILSLSTDSLRMAVVKKEGKLQAAIDMVPFGMQAQDAYCEAQCDMLKAGWVKEE